MARQTRQQRRERRAAQADSTQRQPPRRPPVLAGAGAGGDGSSRPPRPAAEPAGFGPFRFVRESWGELKKVEWPGQHQVLTGTMVVLIACIIVGAYLYANDIVWKHVVQNFLIK
jgi:preprotein translocase SecE subunit